MNSAELTISFEVKRVSRERLVQEISGLEQILFSAIAIGRRQEKIPCASVEIESGEIGGRRPFNRSFFSGRDFRVKLLSDFLRNLALDREHLA